MRLSCAVVLVAICATFVCCARAEAPRSEKEPASAETQPASSSTAHAPSTSTPTLTGILSEEEFKALHQLSTDAPPAARGTLIDLAGTRAYLSVPSSGASPFPALVVIHEWWGLNAHVKHWADRLAADGYAALAVDLYEGRVADNPDSAMAFMKRVDEAKSRETLLAAHAFLASDARVRATSRGAIGWCFGGGQSLRLAIAAPDLDAAVMYYGFPTTDVAELAKIKAHLLGVFGNADKAIPPPAVDAFQAALDSAGVAHKILRYDADHAFANPSNPHYDQVSATAAWNEVREFLDNHLRTAHAHDGH